MVSLAQARQLALAFPEAVEQDHHGRPSFRVAGKIFATLWDEEHMNVMLEEGGILTAVQAHQDAASEVWWGKRLAAVRVNLGRADAELLAASVRRLGEQGAKTAPPELTRAWCQALRVVARPGTKVLLVSAGRRRA